jgi:hypothetical protein
MRKFDRLILEATPPVPPEDDDDNLNFDADPDPDDQNLPVEGEGMEPAPAAIQADASNSPQELELGRIAVSALMASTDGINLKIFDEVETKFKQILIYLDKRLKNPSLEKVTQQSIEELFPDLNPREVFGKGILDKLSFYNQNFQQISDNQLQFWTRIILNALKYDGGDYQITGGDLTPDRIKQTLDKLKADFNFDVKGMHSSITKSRSTGANMSGPGVF